MIEKSENIPTRKKKRLLGKTLIISIVEFKKLFFSTRMVIVMGLFIFMIVAGTYGLSTIGIDNEGVISSAVQDFKLELENPDNVLSISSVLFAFIGSLIAVIFAFDALSSEFLSGSIDMINSKPVKPNEIALGKFFGYLSALVLPTLICFPINILIIYRMYGEMPSIWKAGIMLLFTIIFLATFLLFSLTYSTMARSESDAVISGVFLFLVYGMFWSIIIYAVQSVMGVEISLEEPTYEGLVIIDVFGLANPMVVYQNSAAALFNTKDVHGIPSWSPILFLFLWLAFNIFFYLRVFNKRLREYQGES